MVVENRHTSLREIANESGIAFGTTQDIVVEILCIRRVVSRFVPKDLNFE